MSARGVVIRRSLVLNTLKRAAAENGRRPILLEAPAGFGKTTVLRQWASEDSRLFIWVRLREVRADLKSLLDSVGLALERGPAPDQPYVLVLDGPTGAGPFAAATMGALLAMLPSHCQLVMSSRDRLIRDAAIRSQIPAPLVLGPEQFALTADEARDALKEAGLGEVDEALRLLMHDTQGWAAGVAMAVSALRAEPDSIAAARRLGEHATIVNYFRTEVLARQPVDVSRFLLRSSVLKEMSGPLCDAVLADPDADAGCSAGAAQLADLERRNLFIREDPASAGRYRYHPLFAAVLRAELRLRYPREESELHERAAGWFSEHGQPQRAIEHLIAAGDLEVAARLISLELETPFNAADYQAARSWIRPLGGEASRRCPALGVTAAWIWAMSGDVSRGLHSALEAERGAQDAALPDGGTAVSVEVALLRATTAPLGVEEMLREAEHVLALQPVGTARHLEASALAGVARMLIGDTAGAVATLEHTVALGRQAHPVPAQFALAQLALVAAGRQDSAAAEELLAESMTMMRLNHRQDQLWSLSTYAVGAALAARSEDRRRALSCIDAVGRLNRDWSVASFPWLAAQTAIVVGAALLDLGEVPAARSMAASAAEHVGRLLTEGVLRGQLEDLQQRLSAGDRAPGAVPALGPVGGLSVAEARVLEMLPTHLRLSEIGEQLHLSRNTVKSHVTAIYRKLGCSTRTEAVELARTHGWLAAPGEHDHPLEQSQN